MESEEKRRDISCGGVEKVVECIFRGCGQGKERARWGGSGENRIEGGERRVGEVGGVHK